MKTMYLYFIVCFIMSTTPVTAALEINSVVPDSGKIGERLEVTLTGSDFDLNTRVSMSLDTMNRSLLVGSLDLSGDRAEKVALAGNRAYVANISTLQIVDLSDPTAPALLGEMETGSHISGIDASVNTVYLGNADGLLVIDATDPEYPVVLASLDTPAWIKTVKTDGNYVYVGADGLSIIDVSQPADPIRVSTLDSGLSVRDIAVSGNMLYYIYFRHLESSDAHYMNDICGLRIVDASDPANPSALGVFEQQDTSGWWSLDVSGDLAVVGEGNLEAGCYVLDVSDPLRPDMVSTLTNNEVTDVLLSGKTAYVRMSSDDPLQIVDLSDSQSPEMIGSIDLASRSSWSMNPSLALMGDLLVSLTYSYPSGLEIFNVSRPELPSPLGTLSDIPDTDEIVVQGSLAYLANFRGLLIIDLSCPAYPVAIGSIDTVEGGDKSIVVKDTLVYLVDKNGLHIIDVSVPSTPTLLSSLEIAGQGNGIALSEDTVYMTGEQSGLQIIDVTDPAYPSLIASLPLQGLTDKVAVSGSTVYVTAKCRYIPPGPELYRGLQIIDAGDPAAPDVVGWLELESCPYDLVVSDGTAYVADGGISMIDVSDPTEPAPITSLAMPSFMTRDIELSGDTLYGAFWYEGLQMFDVHDPQRPVTVGSVEGLGAVSKIDVSGKLACVADHSGFTVLPLPVEIDDFTVDDPTSITVTLPRPLVAGYYNIRVFNENESDILQGGVFFSEDIPKQPIVGDWDGDGSTNPGLFDAGTFSLDMDNDGQWDSEVVFGKKGDIPVVGDWDGDGRDELGIFRPAEKMFYLDADGDGVSDIAVGMGRPTDLPLAGDWDNDGRDDIALFRPSTRQYFMDFDEDGISDRKISIGREGDLPLVGDWNGDGFDSIGVYRPDIGRFFLDDDEDGRHDHALSYGTRTDIPLTGDWNRDGVTDVGFYRPSENGFYLDHDFDGLTDQVIHYIEE